MKISLLLTTLLCFASAIGFSKKAFSTIQLQLDLMVQLYKQGETSDAFSIAAKVRIQGKALKQTSSPKNTLFLQDTSCDAMLNVIVSLASTPHWTDSFDDLCMKIQAMQSKCTNQDFVSSQKGGFENRCALCVVVVRVLQNYIAYHKVATADFINKQLCTFFNDSIKATCEAFIHFAGPFVIEALIAKKPADTICLKINYCTNPQCHIIKSFVGQYAEDSLREYSIEDRPAPWQWLVDLFVNKFGNGHLPAFDYDNDSYSDVSTFRGHHWRGADCNEINKNVYPGRKVGNKVLDHDCNGIFGLDVRGNLYEDKFCSEYRRLGIAVIGDSAGAHFSIPQKYMNASMIKKGTYDDLLQRVADQLDLPFESAYTAHINTTYPSHSVYKYLREYNLCNNNDFQNLGVNGGDSGNTISNIKAIARNQTQDHPLLMFMELIGNDVCKKSFESMKKPQDFRRDIMTSLRYLDKTVPSGSHLMIFGLGNGSLLYDYLHADIHPLNITYATLYDFLNCLKISPCWGWLNTNDTVRAFTTERANNLSKVYQQIIDEEQFTNFDVAYYDFPAMDIILRHVTAGNDPHELFQRCDGFHPNGKFNSYLADWIWYTLQTNHSKWIGMKNPHNQDIRKIFNLQILK